MKRKFVALALLISAVVSVTSGCVVREDYGHHHRYRNGYNNGYNHGYHDGDDHGHGHYYDRGY